MNDEQGQPEIQGKHQPHESSPGTPKEPSLGPACLVLAILALAVFCSVCGIGSWFMFNDQYPFAEKSIRQQLIPWVESSQLATADKKSIIAQLYALIPKLQAREINKQQLSRLHFCLQDNPILLWGGVQSILAQAAGAGISESEIPALQRISERLLWMATDRQLSRSDFEFTIQTCAKIREDRTTIEVNSDLSADQIREFMTRSEQLFGNHNVPNEPYDKTPAEAFAILIEKALNSEL